MRKSNLQRSQHQKQILEQASIAGGEQRYLGLSWVAWAPRAARILEWATELSGKFMKMYPTNLLFANLAAVKCVGKPLITFCKITSNY